jgi:hypothetical protein
MRRGASWTAECHPAADWSRRWPGPWRCSLLLSCPIADRPRRRLPGGASGRHPAIEACRSGRDASLPVVPSVAGLRAPFGVHHSVSTNPFRRPGSSCPAVRCPARPVSGHPAPSSGVQPSGVRPPTLSYPSRRGGRLWPARQRRPRTRPPGCAWVRRLRPTDQGRQTGVRSAPVAGDCARAGELAEARRSRAAPRGCRLGLEPRLRSVVVVEPDARVDGPERTNELDGEDGHAAPARPSREVSATGTAQTTL